MVRCCSWLSHVQFGRKTLRGRKWLPQIHLIGCQGVKLFLTKDFCQKLFFLIEFKFLSLSQFEVLNFVTVWVFEIFPTLIWILPKFNFFSFVTIQVFEFCCNLSFWVCLTIKVLSFFTVYVYQFCHNFSFWVLAQFTQLHNLLNRRYHNWYFFGFVAFLKFCHIFSFVQF